MKVLDLIPQHASESLLAFVFPPVRPSVRPSLRERRAIGKVQQ